NRGNATLSLSNYYFTLPSVLSITPAPVTNLAAGASASFTVRFMSTNLGQYTGSLVITNNDANKNPFVLNLTAISNPNGTPPTINITSPTNGSAFTLPGTATITADATPVGTGVTI